MKLHLPKALVALVVAAAMQTQADTGWGWDGTAPTKDGSREFSGRQDIELGQNTGSTNISVTSGTECIWVKKGRGGLGGSLSDSVQAIYAVGGQLFVTTSTPVNAKVFMGGSQYDEPGDNHNLLDGVSVRLSNGSKLANAALVADADIAVYAGADATINNLDLGEYVLTVKGTTGSNNDKAILTIAESVSGTGSINVDSGVLNLGNSNVTTKISGIGQNAEVTGSGNVVLAASNMSVNLQMNNFTGNITIGDGQTLTASATVDNNSKSLSKGDISVQGGGTLSLVGKDALGWSNANGVKNIILQGDSADKKASLNITGVQTLVSGLELKGDTVINANGTGASLSNYDSHSIRVTGTNNINGVEFKVRQDLTIDVVGKKDTFKQDADISAYLGGADWTGKLTKTGAGKMILGNGITLKLNDAQTGGLTSNHAFVVSAGTLEVENGVTQDGGAITVTGGTVGVAGTMTLTNGASISGKASEAASSAMVQVQTKPTRAAGDATLKDVIITNSSISGASATKHGAISDGVVKLDNGASVNYVDFSNSTINLADAANISMEDVVFGSGTTFNGGGTVGSTNSTLVLDADSIVDPVFSAADSAMTLDYSGLGNVTFSGSLTLAPTPDFLLALQHVAIPESCQIVTINFGDSVTFDMREVAFATTLGYSATGTVMDGGHGIQLAFSPHYIPEPATAALSLLALAGLAARRRRK